MCPMKNVSIKEAGKAIYDAQPRLAVMVIGLPTLEKEAYVDSLGLIPGVDYIPRRVQSARQSGYQAEKKKYNGQARRAIEEGAVLDAKPYTQRGEREGHLRSFRSLGAVSVIGVYLHQDWASKDVPSTSEVQRLSSLYGDLLREPPTDSEGYNQLFFVEMS